MKSYFGSYRASGADGAGDEVTVLLFSNILHIGFVSDTGKGQKISWSMKDIEAGFDHRSQATVIGHANMPGIKLVINGKDAEVYIRQMQAEQNKPWYKRDRLKQWLRNGSMLLIIVAVLVGSYLLIVPWLSEKMAGTVSIKTEQRFGDALYGALDLSSREDTDASAVLNEFFTAMKVETAYPISIAVVNSSIVNAFALPGGHIVVYTGLLKELTAYPQLAALLAHEFIHVNNKHATRAVFRKLGGKIFLRLLLGDIGSTAAVIIDQADELKSLKYSRKLESESDEEGLQLLMQRKIDPRGFTGLFAHLKKLAEGPALPDFLNSHPDIDQRMNYVTEVSKNAMVEENSQLKTIFEKLK